MKQIIAITLTALLSACSTSEMVAMSQVECNQIGYAAGTPEHTACVERGYRTRDAQQDALISTAGMWAVLEAIY